MKLMIASTSLLLVGSLVFPAFGSVADQHAAWLSGHGDPFASTDNHKADEADKVPSTPPSSELIREKVPSTLPSSELIREAQENASEETTQTKGWSVTIKKSEIDVDPGFETTDCNCSCSEAVQMQEQVSLPAGFAGYSHIACNETECTIEINGTIPLPQGKG